MYTAAIVGVLIVAAVFLTVSSIHMQRETIEMFADSALPKCPSSQYISPYMTALSSPDGAAAAAAAGAVGAVGGSGVPVASTGATEFKPPLNSAIPEGSSPSELEMGKRVLEVYEKVLKRMPSAREYKEKIVALESKKLTLEQLEQQLYSSPEYARYVKMQSNATFPELSKVIHDLRLIRRVIELYKAELAKEPLPTLRIPLKDALIYLEHNEVAFREMLRSPKYAEWEASIIENPLVGRVDVEASIERYFIKDTLMRLAASRGTAAQEKTDAKDKGKGKEKGGEKGGEKEVSQMVLQKPNVYIVNMGGASVSQMGDIEKLIAASDVKNKRSIKEEDTDMQCMLDDIHKKKQQKQRVYFTKDDLVLRPEFAWKMPERRPPVCTNLPGKKPVDIAPVLDSSKLLLGTPLCADTGVGSIMPKFEFREYIEV